MTKGRMAKSVGPVRSFVILHLLLATLALSQSYTSGLILEQAGQLDRAFDEYRLTLNKNPQDQPAYEGFVRLAEQLKRYDTLLSAAGWPGSIRTCLTIHTDLSAACCL